MQETVWKARAAGHTLEVVRFEIDAAYHGGEPGERVSGHAYYVHGRKVAAGSLWSPDISADTAKAMALRWLRENHPKAAISIVFDRIPIEAKG